MSKKGAEYDAASQSGKSGYWGKSGSDWDAYGRDQDLSIKESYDRTWAKSYDAESYDEWDNTDDDFQSADTADEEPDYDPKLPEVADAKLPVPRRPRR